MKKSINKVNLDFYNNRFQTLRHIFQLLRESISKFYWFILLFLLLVCVVLIERKGQEVRLWGVKLNSAIYEAYSLFYNTAMSQRLTDLSKENLQLKKDISAHALEKAELYVLRQELLKSFDGGVSMFNAPFHAVNKYYDELGGLYAYLGVAFPKGSAVFYNKALVGLVVKRLYGNSIICSLEFCEGHSFMAKSASSNIKVILESNDGVIRVMHQESAADLSGQMLVTALGNARIPDGVSIGRVVKCSPDSDHYCVDAFYSLKDITHVQVFEG